MDIRHHFIRENLQDGILKIDYIDTKNQLADMLTNALGTKILKFMCEATGIKNNLDSNIDTQQRRLGVLRLRRFMQSFHVGFMMMISLSGCFMVLVTEEGYGSRFHDEIKGCRYIKA